MNIDGKKRKYKQKDGRRVTGPYEGKLPPIKLGKSAGQKVSTGAITSQDVDQNALDEYDSEVAKANKKQVSRMREKAKAGKQKAKKALNMSNVSDERLDEILAATGEQQDRSRRKAGLLR